MYQKKIKPDFRSPLEYGISLFGGKWKPRLICLLYKKGVMRFNEMKKALGDITDSVLSLSLKELQRDELVFRRVYEEMPPKVEYFLTEKGKSLISIFENICRWSSHYCPDVKFSAVCEACPNREKSTEE